MPTINPTQEQQYVLHSSLKKHQNSNSQSTLQQIYVLTMSPHRGSCNPYYLRFMDKSTHLVDILIIFSPIRSALSLIQ